MCHREIVHPHYKNTQFSAVTRCYVMRCCVPLRIPKLHNALTKFFLFCRVKSTSEEEATTQVKRFSLRRKI